jgi:hypothetical protein
MPVLPRLILMLGVALYHPASALRSPPRKQCPRPCADSSKAFRRHDSLIRWDSPERA